MPIATTVLAALTTTALADAYSGVDGAGSRALWLVAATSAVSIVMLAWNSVSNYVSQRSRYMIDAAIEDQMMTKFASLPFALYDDKETIDLHDKANRFSYFFSYIFDTIGQILTAVFSAVGSIIALGFINIWLAFAVLVAVMPGIVIQLRLARQQARHWEGNITNRRRKGNLGWMMRESRYIAEMRVYGVMRHLIEMYARLRDKDEKERLGFELKTIWKQLIADVVEAIVELGALIWVVLQIIDRAQPIGQFVYVQQMVTRALSQASTIASQLGRIDEDLANLVDYQHFVEISHDEPGGAQLDSPPQNIIVDDVHFHYPKTKRDVLRGVSLDIASGEHVAIVGENGAGKSTLIKLLLGLYHPTGGKINIDGRDLKKIKSDTLHRHIALLGQDFVSYYFATIKENIYFGDVSKPFNSRKMREAMESAEFREVVEGLDHKEDTFIERWMARDNDEASAIEMSGGQYQRMALARNFYRDAPIMILDEPTSAIDALAESRIFNRLFELEKTIIVVSHRLSTIRKADRVYMMEDGKIVEAGAVDELLAARGPFYRMFESQIK